MLLNLTIDWKKGRTFSFSFLFFFFLELRKKYFLEGDSYLVQRTFGVLHKGVGK